jgi:hypothetical protein
MGRASSTLEGDKKCIQKLEAWLENLKGRDLLEDLNIDGRIILK